MRRSAYENEFQVRRYRDTKYSPELSKIAAALAEEAGVQWDPEEPELPEWPERLEVPDGACFFWWPGKKLFIQLGKLRTVYQEAARRYNAYPALEALARELTKAVKVFHDGLFPYCPECKLVRRARDLGLLPEED